MSDLHALQTVLDRALAARDQALAAHHRALAAAQAASAQAGQLAGYRREYAERFGGQFRRNGAIELLQCYQSFMARLDDAVAQQGRAVEQAEARAGEAQAALLAAELRVGSVRKLMERRMAEAALRRERREQQATDEFASRAAWQRLANAGDALGVGTA